MYNLQPWYNNWWNGNFPTSRWWKMSKIAQSISITSIIINTTEMQSLTSVFLYLHHPKRQSEMKCIGRNQPHSIIRFVCIYKRCALWPSTAHNTDRPHLPDRLTDWAVFTWSASRLRRRRECVLGNCELNCALKSQFGQPSLLWRWSLGSEQKAQDDNLLCCVISHNLWMWAFRYIDTFK